MAHDVQIVIDSARPHELADWWAEVLGWEVEPQDEAFIRRMVDEGHASADQTTRHKGALVWAVGAAIRSPEPGRSRVLFQSVPEAKTVKNRVHLCLRPETSRDPEVERLTGLGATLVDDLRNPDGSGWAVLADPEGNEFCVLRSESDRAATS